MFLVLFLLLIAGSGISGICVQTSGNTGKNSQNTGLLSFQKESNPSFLDQPFGIDSSELITGQLHHRSGWVNPNVFDNIPAGSGLQQKASQTLITDCDAFRSANMMAELPVSSVVNPFQTASAQTSIEKVGSGESTGLLYSDLSFRPSYNNFDSSQLLSHHFLTTVLPMSGGMAIGAP
jgi:hypothetical protein